LGPGLRQFLEGLVALRDPAGLAPLEGQRALVVARNLKATNVLALTCYFAGKRKLARSFATMICPLKPPSCAALR
jgi:hypothetical protein